MLLSLCLLILPHLPGLYSDRSACWMEVFLQALASEDEEEEKKEKKGQPKKAPKKAYVVSGGLTGFGVAQDLLNIDFSPPEEAPDEFRAMAFNEKKVTILKSGKSGELVPQNA